MHVAARPMECPVALIEHRVAGVAEPSRILVFQEGLLPRPVIALLGRLLGGVP